MWTRRCPPYLPAGGRNLVLFASVAAAMLVAGCRQGMYDQPRYEPLEANRFFEDSLSARPLVSGTVARFDAEAPVPADVREGQTAFPMRVTEAVMARGRERYGIYCSPCHGLTGDGFGIVVLRGFTPPPTFHSPRLRAMSAGHVVRVIEHGIGRMYPYAARVEPEDRWAIAAYIFALQRSRHATPADVPPSERSFLGGHDSPPDSLAP